MKKETRNTWKSYVNVVESSRQTQVENGGWGVEGGLEELRTPPSQLQIRHEHSDLAKVNQPAHDSTPRWPGVGITIYNQSAGRMRQEDREPEVTHSTESSRSHSKALYQKAKSQGGEIAL